MKGTIFLLALSVLCLSLCSTFAKSTRALLKCKTKKGGQITRGTLITRKNWSSSDLESKKMTWKECREFCEEYTNYGYLPKAKCAGWSYAYDLAFDTVPVSLILILCCSAPSVFRRVSRFGGGCSIYKKVKKFDKEYACMCDAYAGLCK